jgi:hypothetical protein
MPYPDYLDQNPKIIFFTDFDGTITREDCCDWLVCIRLNVFKLIATLADIFAHR